MSEHDDAIQRQDTPEAPPPPPPTAPADAASGGSGPSLAGKSLAFWLIASGLVLAAIGSILPWATVSAPFGLGEITVNGTDGDGTLTLVLAIVGLVLAFPLVQDKALSKGRTIGLLVAAGLIALIAVIDIADINRVADENDVGGLLDVTIGFGLWVVLVGAIDALVGAVMTLRAGRPATTP